MLRDREHHGMLARMRGFTDGVFSIVLTLLVLGLVVPKVKAQTDSELIQLLKPLAISFGTYLISFTLVGVFWLIHVMTDRALKSADRPMLAANLVSLLPVTLLPFTTELGTHFHSPLGWAIYSGDIALAALATIGLWMVVVRRGHADGTGLVGFALIPYRSAIIAAVFTLSITAEYLIPHWGRIIPIYLAPVTFRLLKRYKPDPALAELAQAALAAPQGVA